MSITAASLIVDVDADTRSAEKKLSTFGSSAKTILTGAMMGVGIVLTQSLINAAQSAMGSIGQAVQGASDFNETLSKTNAILGDAAAGVISFSKTAATQLGMTQNAALQAAGNFAVFGKSAGLAGDDLGGFAESLTTLAADLASFYNTSPERAIQSIGAALRGESEPIRAYGVLLNEATLRQRALSMGLIKTTKEALTPQNKVLAASAEIFAQTADAQGDFAKTSGFLANQQRIMAAQMGEVSNVIGTSFLPVWLEFTAAANRALEEILPALGTVLDMYVTPAMLSLADGVNTAGEYLATFLNLLARGADPLAAFIEAFHLQPIVDGFNDAISATEYWLNASIGAFNDWLLGVDMIVTAWFKGTNLIIDGANSIIAALVQVSIKARELAAIMALTRGDIGGVMTQMNMASLESGIRIPELQRPNTYLTTNAMDFQQLGRMPTSVEDLGELPDALSGTQRAAFDLTDALSGVTTSVGNADKALSDLSSALGKIPGLMSVSPVTAQDMARAEAGLPVNYADNYVRRAKDELINGIDWADIDPAEVASSVGLDPSVPAQLIVDELTRQWETGEYFANPENLSKIDWQAVKDAALKEANAVLGNQNIVAEAMAQGITIESFKPLATDSVGKMAVAITESIYTPDNTAALEDAGEKAYSIWFRGWQTGAANAPVTPPSGSGSGSRPNGAIGPSQQVTLPNGFVLTIPPLPGNAQGTSWWPGGATWVGEEGPEIVVPPHGSRIVPNDMSGGINVTVNASVANDLDLDRLALRLADVIQRNRRRQR